MTLRLDKKKDSSKCPLETIVIQVRQHLFSTAYVCFTVLLFCTVVLGRFRLPAISRSPLLREARGRVFSRTSLGRRQLSPCAQITGARDLVNQSELSDPQITTLTSFPCQNAKMTSTFKVEGTQSHSVIVCPLTPWLFIQHFSFFCIEVRCLSH